MGMRGVSLGLLVALCFSFYQSEAQLQLGYYKNKCQRVEAIVKDEVRKGVRSNPGLAAGLVRLHFHDCFVRGCDGSVLIDSTANNKAEKDAAPNNPSLRGFEIIDKAKLRIEAECKKTVSCADILAFAARDSFQLSGGFHYQVPAGRRDGRVSLLSGAISLPPPFANLSQLTQIFASKGLSQDEMITLSGAHTIGRSNCVQFTNRLYSFNSTVSQDPSLDPTYANKLKKQCPNGSRNANLVVPMDPPSPASFDASYYAQVLANRGLLASDQTLVSTPASLAQVRRNANKPQLFKRKFAAAMVKMGRIGVLTGRSGEVRRNCRVIN